MPAPIRATDGVSRIGGAKFDADSGDEVDHFVYTPQLVVLDDEILDKSDTKLIQAIQSFKRGQSEEQIVMKRVESKGLSLLWNQIKQGRVGVIVSATYKAMLRKRKSDVVMSPSETLVKTLDEMVERKRGGKRTRWCSFNGPFG